MSVSSFSKLLIDEISEKLRFSAVIQVLQRENAIQNVAVESHGSLQDKVGASIIDFMTDYKSNPISNFQTEMELTGALAAYLTRAHPDYEIRPNVVLNDKKWLRADMVVTKGSDRLILELKRLASRSMINRGLRQLEGYLDLSDAAAGLLFTYGGNDVAYGLAYRNIGTMRVTLVAPVAFLNDDLEKTE